MLEDFEESKDAKLGRLTGEVRAAGGEVGFATFAEVLFRHAAGEDIAHYSVDHLMRIARGGWQSLKRRTPGQPRVEVVAPDDVAVTETDTGRAITIIEALNDDQPFLFGSLKNELHAQDLDIHLIVHPIFSVERDDEGNLVRFHGEARHGDGHAHESFVHIHVSAMDDPEARAALAGTLNDVIHDVTDAVED
ncbi:MAG: hypothetical protein AAGF49_05565, partial [Pseudomonadota bacterium]